MTDTTDIAALREICEILNEYGYDPDWEGGGVHVDNAAKTVRMIIMQHCESSTMLEPERQLTNESGERFYKAVQYVAKLESEIAALKAKLANPVVLPAKLPDEGYGGGAVRNWCRNESVADCARRITEAGFTVKRE